jgi:hypothetical protein
MSGEDIEFDDDAGHKVVAFFKEPIAPEKIKECPVNEEYLSAYEETKAEEKIIKQNLEIMNDAIKAARMPGEKTLRCGKLVAFFTDIDAPSKVDWEQMAREMIGNDKGEIDAETLTKYTRQGKPQTRLEVRRT